ncbi:MAG: glycosyltransferase family 2 protein [Rhodospirillales bacterium]|nr:glycosyltransferase family 2 protein [Rhodospirillales bacterium]
MKFPDDPELTLLIPDNDEPTPELSIVIPALNEESVIVEFMNWCHEGIAKAGVKAEIMILDSSTDKTPDIALSMGARILKMPKRGLGRAYIDSIPVIRGKYVILGDADCTYDFREIQPFMEHFHSDHEFVIGSRFAGSIENGAMPALHRYFGTPLTIFILNVIYGSNFSDIHCGMRGVTIDAFKRMNLQSQSWEYASEMIVKSVRLKLRTVEAPVHFYKDKEGRESHHKRIGWFSPWHAGWINLRAMLIHGADFFVMKPGIVMLLLGLLITLPLCVGPVSFGDITLSLNTMFLGATFSIVGLQSFFLGCMAQSLYDPSGVTKKRWVETFAYTPMMIVSGSVFTVGLLLCVNFAMAYAGAGFTLFDTMVGTNHLAVMGLLAIALSFISFISTLLLHAIHANMLIHD